MPKNAQIHFFLNTELFEKLKIEAERNCQTLSEYCRDKLRRSDQLDEILLILKKNRNHGNK
ncbi:MAG: hypothetical protein AABY07_01725 [Nanoarchaeota archaeon]